MFRTVFLNTTIFWDAKTCGSVKSTDISEECITFRVEGRGIVVAVLN
jgi:hypothetical protein